MTPQLTLQERRAKDSAFKQALAELRPEFALVREIVAARVRLGWTQEELARRMGTGQSAIARLERGLSSPRVATLQRLAEVTGSRLVVRLDVRG
jgi:ribosome-binding protein aMBF1 (putative translation factor)